MANANSCSRHPMAPQHSAGAKHGPLCSHASLTLWQLVLCVLSRGICKKVNHPPEASSKIKPSPRPGGPASAFLLTQDTGTAGPSPGNVLPSGSLPSPLLLSSKAQPQWLLPTETSLPSWLRRCPPTPPPPVLLCPLGALLWDSRPVQCCELVRLCVPLNS